MLKCVGNEAQNNCCYTAIFELKDAEMCILEELTKPALAITNRLFTHAGVPGNRLSALRLGTLYLTA